MRLNLDSRLLASTHIKKSQYLIIYTDLKEIIKKIVIKHLEAFIVLDSAIECLLNIINVCILHVCLIIFLINFYCILENIHL